MRKFAFLGILCLFSMAFAESFRILDTPRCRIDLDVSNNIVNVSKCPITHDQYYGDSTFSIAVVCHDTKKKSITETIKLYPKALKESEQDDESYLEITQNTNYSFRVEFAIDITEDEPVIFSSETVFNWIREGRLDWCRLWYGSPHDIKRITW